MCNIMILKQNNIFKFLTELKPAINWDANSLPGKVLSMHLIEENIYYDLDQGEMKLCAANLVDNIYRNNFKIETPANSPELIIEARENGANIGGFANFKKLLMNFNRN